jgi:hypothetical protein
MHLPSARPVVVHYRFSCIPIGFRLELWEPLSTVEQGRYRFCWCCDYASEYTALTALQDYLQTNRPVRAIADPIGPSAPPENATAARVTQIYPYPHAS